MAGVITGLLPAGFLHLCLTFGGRTASGRIVKVAGSQAGSSTTMIEPVNITPVYPPPTDNIRIPVITEVTCSDFYPVRLTDITLAHDTVINFTLTQKNPLPYKTQPTIFRC
jgi:hypothetical protein